LSVTPTHPLPQVVLTVSKHLLHSKPAIATRSTSQPNLEEVSTTCGSGWVNLRNHWSNGLLTLQTDWIVRHTDPSSTADRVQASPAQQASDGYPVNITTQLGRGQYHLR